MTEQPEENHDVARKLGRSAGKFARAARAAAKRAQPEAERYARRARPIAEGASRRAGKFLTEHEGQIRQAGATSARIVVNRTTPPLLRPIVSVVVDEMARQPQRRLPPGEAEPPDEPPRA